jgi:hypothetical protein
MTQYYVFFNEGGTSETFAAKAETKGTIEAGEVKVMHMVEVSASTAQRAAEACREGMGLGNVTQAFRVGTTANIESKNP